MTVEAFQRLRKVLGHLGVKHHQEIGEDRPSWTLSYDPATGVMIISNTEELFSKPREIDKVGGVVQMVYHDIRRQWNEGRSS